MVNIISYGGGRYSSGVGIGCLDPQGNVHADPFWSDSSFGYVRHRPFPGRCGFVRRERSAPLTLEGKTVLRPR